MNFKTVTSVLLERFAGSDIRYALIGGFALGLWGVARATIDLDFLVNRNDLARIDEIMKSLAYKRAFGSENVSQYLSSEKTGGEIDFLHAFRQASLEMLERAVAKPIFGGEMTIRVLIPEDLIGLKMQAVKNNPARRGQDVADIRALFRAHGSVLDQDLIRKYAVLLDAHDLLREAEKP